MTTKILPLALIAISLSIQFASGQTSIKPDRRVKKQTLVSETLPKIRLKFGKKFKFAGSQEFVLYGRAKAKQYFFVEAEDKRIMRMYMVQFEGYLRGVAGSYDYNEPQKVAIGGLEYFANAEYVPDVLVAAKAVPGSDTARAVEFLQGKGFMLPNSLVYQRFVRTVDSEKRDEIIVLYIEETTAGDPATKDSLLKALSGKALKEFKVSL